MRREPPDRVAHSPDDEETVFLRRAKILEPILTAKEAYLVPIAGRGLWERYPLTKMETVIGRKPGVDLLLQDGRVSRRHCKILLSDKGPQIHDLGSTNGTFVNEARVEKRYLQDGDLIRLGETVIRFRYVDKLEAKREEELYCRATRDGLTGLHNRPYFLEVLEDELSRSRRHNLVASLLLIDIDHFKAINDKYGHSTGDLVLKEIASILGRGVRREDTLARYGGEEFILIAPQTETEGARIFGERLRGLVEKHSFAHEEEFSITISVGIATFPRHAQGAEELIESADRALYKAKAGGRNLVCIIDDRT
jgi:diguanylate cyclase (GGDEF)-like protein